MKTLLDLLLVASMSVFKILLITIVGLFLALKRVDILGETARHHLNQVLFFVFSPALIGSYVAQTITFKSFITMWFMPLSILLTFVIGSALGWVLGKLTRAPKHIMGLAMASCSAGNLGALPIIIIPAMCKQKGSPLGAVDICKQFGLAYTSLTMAIGAIYIWLYTYNIMRILSKDDKTSMDDIERSETLSSMNQSLEASTDNISNSSKCLIALSFRITQCLRTTLGKINLKAILVPSIVGAIVGFFIGMINPVQKLLFGNDAPLHIIGDTTLMIGDAAVPCMALILGANLLKGLKGSRIQITIVVGIIAVRYIILPLVGIMVVKGAVRAGFVQSHDPLFQFVLLLQYALPPALNIGTMTELFGVGQSECSVIMLWSYGLAPVTLTLWSTVFLWLVA